MKYSAKSFKVQFFNVSLMKIFSDIAIYENLLSHRHFHHDDVDQNMCHCVGLNFQTYHRLEVSL